MEAEAQVEEGVNQGVDRLVAEIERAVALIERLRQENAELQQRIQELQDRTDRQTQDLTELRADRDRLQKLYDDNASLIENKEGIQHKIETMLSRLDAVSAE